MELITDTDRLLETSNQLLQSSECLQQCMIDIELLINSISCEWMGAAASEYVGKIVSLKYEYTKLEKLIADFSEILKTAADYYESYDSALARKIDSI